MQASIQPTNKPAAVTNIASNPLPTIRIPTAEEIAAISNKAVEALKIKLPEIVEAHNVPIYFWGKVVDQDDNPLAGVHVVMSIRQAGYSPIEGLQTLYPQKDIQTDSDGRFQWTGEKGDVLSIESMERVGYELEPNAKRYFGYNTGERFVPDSNVPVVFKMWQTNIHEHLIVGERKFQIVPDGRAYFINLTDGTIAESTGGDLKVWVSEKTLTNGSYDWSCEIGVVNGGLLEETDPHSSMFSAPVDDYTPAFQLQQQFKGDPRGESGERRFYLKLKDGQEYGRMTIDLYAPFNNQTPGLIRLSYAINPSGSRILR